MVSLQQILDALSTESIRENVDRPIEETLTNIQLPDTVSSSEEFLAVIEDAYRQLQGPCPAFDGPKSGYELVGEIYRRKDSLAQYIEEKTMIYGEMALEDARNGRLPEIIREMAEVIREEKKRIYVRSAINAELFQDQLAVTTELFQVAGDSLPAYIDRSKPEKYAKDCKWLIMQYANHIRDTEQTINGPN